MLFSLTRMRYDVSPTWQSLSVGRFTAIHSLTWACRIDISCEINA